MANDFSRLAQTQPGLAAAIIYTAPASTDVIIKHIRAVNTSASPVTLTMYQSGSTGDHMILPAATIAGNGWAEFDGNIICSDADVLYALASVASTVTVTLYGLAVS